MNSLCQICRKMLYRTDACKGDGVECGRADGGSKKSTERLVSVSPRSSKVERPQKAVDKVITRDVAGSTPAVDASNDVSIKSLSDKLAVAEAALKDVMSSPKHKDRHKPGYQAQKQREYRAKRKAAK